GEVRDVARLDEARRSADQVLPAIDDTRAHERRIRPGEVQEVFRAGVAAVAEESDAGSYDDPSPVQLKVSVEQRLTAAVGLRHNARAGVGTAIDGALQACRVVAGR